MCQGRNAGWTLYSAGQRMKAWPPAMLANVRTAMLWKPKTDDKYDINGVIVPRAQCGESSRIVFRGLAAF